MKEIDCLDSFLLKTENSKLIFMQDLTMIQHLCLYSYVRIMKIILGKNLKKIYVFYINLIYINLLDTQESLKHYEARKTRHD